MSAVKVDYQKYLASREWRLKRQEVIQRYGNVCWRCQDAPIENIHHLTYERVGHEEMDDLMGVCRPCHEYLSAERKDDPAVKVIWDLIGKGGIEPEWIDISRNMMLLWQTRAETSLGRIFFVEFVSSDSSYVADMQKDLAWTIAIPLDGGVTMLAYWS